MPMPTSMPMLMLRCRCRDFQMAHFLAESELHERIDLLITASVNICQTKKEKKNIPVAMKTCFSEEKLMKQFGNPPLSKRTPLFN